MDFIYGLDNYTAVMLRNINVLRQMWMDKSSSRLRAYLHSQHNKTGKAQKIQIYLSHIEIHLEYSLFCVISIGSIITFLGFTTARLLSFGCESVVSISMTCVSEYVLFFT